MDHPNIPATSSLNTDTSGTSTALRIRINDPPPPHHQQQQHGGGGIAGDNNSNNVPGKAGVPQLPLPHADWKSYMQHQHEAESSVTDSVPSSRRGGPGASAADDNLPIAFDRKRKKSETSQSTAAPESLTNTNAPTDGGYSSVSRGTVQKRRQNRRSISTTKSSNEAAKAVRKQMIGWGDLQDRSKLLEEKEAESEEGEGEDSDEVEDDDDDEGAANNRRRVQKSRSSGSSFMHPFWLSFNADLEDTFAQWVYVENFQGALVWVALCVGLNSWFLAYYMETFSFTGMWTDPAWAPMACQTVLTFILGIGLLIPPLKRFREWLYLLALSTHFPAVTIAILHGKSPHSFVYFFITLCYFFNGFTGQQRFSRVMWILLLAPIVTLFCATFPFSYWSDHSELEIIFWFFIFFPMVLLRKFESVVRLCFLNVQNASDMMATLRQRIDSTRELLSNLVPPTAALMLHQSKGATIFETYQDTVVIVTDIVSFTRWTARTEPAIVIAFLSRYFNLIDDLTALFGVEKVATVGDSFLGCVFPFSIEEEDQDQQSVDVTPNTTSLTIKKTSTSNVSRRKKGPKAKGLALRCVQAVEFASALHEITAVDVPSSNGDISEPPTTIEVNQRIGLHYGRVIGAFVGRSPIKYDIFGRAVKMAKECEHCSIPRKTRASAALFNVVEPYILFKDLQKEDLPVSECYKNEVMGYVFSSGRRNAAVTLTLENMPFKPRWAELDITSSEAKSAISAALVELANKKMIAGDGAEKQLLNESMADASTNAGSAIFRKYPSMTSANPAPTPEEYQLQPPSVSPKEEEVSTSSQTPSAETPIAKPMQTTTTTTQGGASLQPSPTAQKQSEQTSSLVVSTAEGASGPQSPAGGAGGDRHVAPDHQEEKEKETVAEDDKSLNIFTLTFKNHGLEERFLAFRDSTTMDMFGSWFFFIFEVTVFSCHVMFVCMNTESLANKFLTLAVFLSIIAYGSLNYFFRHAAAGAKVPSLVKSGITVTFYNILPILASFLVTPQDCSSHYDVRYYNSQVISMYYLCALLSCQFMLCRRFLTRIAFNVLTCAIAYLCTLIRWLTYDDEVMTWEIAYGLAVFATATQSYFLEYSLRTAYLLQDELINLTAAQNGLMAQALSIMLPAFVVDKQMELNASLADELTSKLQEETTARLSARRGSTLSLRRKGSTLLRETDSTNISNNNSIGEPLAPGRSQTYVQSISLHPNDDNDDEEEAREMKGRNEEAFDPSSRVFEIRRKASPASVEMNPGKQLQQQLPPNQQGNNNNMAQEVSATRNGDDRTGQPGIVSQRQDAEMDENKRSKNPSPQQQQTQGGGKPPKHNSPALPPKDQRVSFSKSASAEDNILGVAPTRRLSDETEQQPQQFAGSGSDPTEGPFSGMMSVDSLHQAGAGSLIGFQKISGAFSASTSPNNRARQATVAPPPGVNDHEVKKEEHRRNEELQDHQQLPNVASIRTTSLAGGDDGGGSTNRSYVRMDDESVPERRIVAESCTSARSLTHGNNSVFLLERIPTCPSGSVNVIGVSMAAGSTAGNNNNATVVVETVNSDEAKSSVLGGGAQENDKLQLAQRTMLWEYPFSVVMFISFTMENEAHIQEAHSTFLEIEEILRSCGLRKIKTIQSVLLAVGGIETTLTPTENIINACFAMRDARAKSLRRRWSSFSIGIHCGSCFGAVMGQKCLMFDIFGDTVNTASRMQTTAQDQGIRCSAAVAQVLQAEEVMEVVALPPVHIKGKGEMEVFELVG